jgi:signal transduction histidine kinase
MNGAGEVFENVAGEWIRKFSIAPWGKPFGPDGTNWLGDGQIWRFGGGVDQWLMPSEAGLLRIQGEDFWTYDLSDGRVLRHETIPPLADYNGRFMVTANGRVLALMADHVLALEGDRWRPFPDSPGYTPKQALVIHDTPNGTLWAGVEQGIERWKSGEVRYFGDDDDVRSEDAFHCIRQTRSGDLWFGSMGGGIYRYDGNTFHNIDKSDGLQSNSVRNIFEAENGAIWIAYREQGVSRYEDGRWVHFSLAQGLPNVPVTGFADVAPSAVLLHTRDRQLYDYLPDREAPDTEIVAGPQFVAPHGVGLFSFKGWDAWEETDAAQMLYSWRVLATDAKTTVSPWSSFGDAKVVVTAPLAAGDYRFEVRGSDENGNVDPTPAHMSFTVSPPFWMKPGFYFPVGLSLLLALIAMTFRYRTHVALQRSETELRQSEAILKTHRDNLEELVRERTRELEYAQIELIKNERLATLGQLTATVSHELRNPLATLQSSLSVIGNRVEDQGLNLEGAIERSTRSIRRCDHIIEELLDFTRTQTGDLRIVHIDQWLEDTARDISVPAALRLEFELGCDARVRIDEEQIRRALINLMDNAVQAMADNEGGEKRIIVRSEVADGLVMIYIDDSGPGIPEETLELILDPLYSTKNFGVGLGTNIVQNILERHGGGVAYSNLFGSGARAALWLPIAEER